jgi:hypothetical protein
MTTRTNGSTTTGIPPGPPAAAVQRSPAPPPKLRRRPWLAILGALLVAGSGLAAWFLVTSGSTTTGVVAMAATVDRGQVIQATDLTVASINPDRALATIPADTLTDLVGQRAATDLPEGTLVTPDSVDQSLTPPAGAALVGVTLSPSQLPAEPLRPGDTIRLVATPRPGDDLPGGEPQTFQAGVVSSTYLEETAQTTVDVQVAAEDAAQVAALASTGRVALVLDTREQ